MRECKIIFTGGGSGGHVMTALSIIKSLNTNHSNKNVIFKVEYIGGLFGIEKEIILKNQIIYYGIQNGKLRRYLSFENLKDFFRILMGVWQSFKILKKFDKKNTIVFSTGGFVSVPVVIAACLGGIPVFIHEQTSRVGLANKISSYFAHKVFVSFEESVKYFPVQKTILSGYPLRDECFSKNINEVVLENLSISPRPDVKILFATGGGNGSLLINNLIKKNLDWLTKDFLVIHQVGQNFIQEYKKYQSARYIPVKFVDQGMIDLMKMSDIVISRAGAGTVCELMAIRKKSIFIPLKIAQKNEQFHNAMEAQRKMGSIIIEEDNLEKTNLNDLISKIRKVRPPDQFIDSVRAQKIIEDEIIKLVGENER